MTTPLQQMADGQDNAHIVFNEVAETLSATGCFGKRHGATSGLTWGYYGGLYNGASVADGTVALANGATNYIVVKRSTGVVSVSTSSANSLSPLYAKLYKVTTAGGIVTDVVDQRLDYNGLLLGDVKKVPRRTSGLASGECLATDANVTIDQMEESATVSIYNDSGASISLTAGTAVTLRLAGTATTGTRTLAQHGMATVWFNSASEAVVSGAGVS